MKTETIKVLLIDDDEDDYILTRELLSEVKVGKYALDWASSYEEGLRVVGRREHHVCLVDYRLGERSGVQLIREAWAARLTTPMILLTGQGNHDVDVEAMQAGATDYLVKDKTPTALLERTLRYAVEINTERCRAEEALAAYAQKQAVVAEIGRLALTGGELEDLFAEAVSLVARTLGVEYCKVLEVLPDGEALILRAGVGWKEEYRVGEATVSAGKDSQAGFTLLSDGPAVVEDLRTETRFSGAPLLLEHGVVSGMSVIIRGRERPYGVLGAHTASKRSFTDDDVNFLHSVANVLAEAIGRKHAEDKIRKSEARFRRVVESNMLGMLSWDISGEITGANDAFLEMVGYTREDSIAGLMRWTEMTPPEYRKLDEKALKELAISGVCETYEKEYIRKDGSRVPILLGCATLDGETQRGVGFVLDITKRRRAEQELRETVRSKAESLALLDSILSTAPIGFAFHNRDLTYQRINETLAAINGLPVEQHLGKTLREVLPAMSVVLEPLLQRVIDTGEPILDLEISAETPADLSSQHHWLVSCYPVHMQEGELLGVGVLVSEISERKLAERALRESEERYRDLVENAHDLIYEHDLEGNYTATNKAGEQLTGYSLEETLKLNLTQVVAPEYVEKAQQMFRRKLAGEKIPAYELEIVTKDGKTVAVEQNTRIVYQNGLPIGVQGIARDVTERKQLEDQLRQSQKLEAIGQLAGGVAHDFNNLLTVIGGYSSILLGKLDQDSPHRASIEEIKRAGERAEALTRQLLAFSRKQILQPRVLDLNVVITDLEKMVRRLIGEDIDLLTISSPVLGKVKADPGQIEQVLLNLIVNARDAMPKGGKLTIETRNVELSQEYALRHATLSGPHVMLTVSDSGSGMSAAIQARVFEPFFTTKGTGKGTGLGLATVYGIVKQSGGNIRVYSEVGMGSTFKIWLPRVDEVIESEEEAILRSIPRGTETVLLVEDEDQVRAIVKEMLEGQGYHVLVASNGEEALAISQNLKLDIKLIMTDVVMPQMSGRDLAEDVIALRPGLPVLFMSGYTDDAIVRHGLLDEKLDFLQKPFDSATLARKVRELLDSHLDLTPA